MSDEKRIEPTTKTDGGDEQIDERRRALVRAGWAVPIVTSVTGLSSTAAYAQSPHSDNHSDAGGGHNDAPPHNDAPHNDAPHADAPHNDHGDVHGDVPSRGHGDMHDDVTVLHVDIPHGDIGGFGTPHIDTAFAHGDSHNDVPAFP